ncbi:9530_t:CDS:2 [Ambispora gerdemannii]|uniref:9530_t:CDS:1 n=1 Tax=Ambispora gerdemannii TaxID=144530 RepID=A0A9N8WK73_9GLOM|nr:9530_t:CDS:2 [Ambispora gerdemannii]
MENNNNTNNRFTSFNREQTPLNKIHSQIRVILESHAKTTAAIMELCSMLPSTIQFSLGSEVNIPLITEPSSSNTIQVVHSTQDDYRNSYYDDRFASKYEISENEETTENALMPEWHYAEGRTRSNIYHLRKDDDIGVTTPSLNDTAKSRHSTPSNHPRKRGRGAKIVGSSASSPYTTTNPTKRNSSVTRNPEVIANQQQLLNDFTTCFNRRIAQGMVSQTKIAQEITNFVKDEAFHVHQVDVSNMCKGKLPASFKLDAVRNWIAAENAKPIVVIQQEEQIAQDGEQETYTTNVTQDDEIAEN